MPRKKRIAVIGGGTGTYTVLTGLKKYPLDLTAIVSMSDDGGSTGILREEFGILPPGDVRRALMALSSHPEAFLSKLFAYRFQEGGMNGHNFGNLILTALERVTGSFEEAVNMAAKMLDVQNGRVIPVTLSNVRLYAELEDGQVVKGETNIDIPKHDGSLKVKRVWLEPSAHANPQALRSIREADLIVMGPGDLYTSLLPNLLVSGICPAILKSKAKKIYVMNLMTKFGETHGFTAIDFITVLERHLKKGVLDAVIVNTKKPSDGVLQRYHQENAYWVDSTVLRQDRPDITVIKESLMRAGQFIRHDSGKLARAIMKCL